MKRKIRPADLVRPDKILLTGLKTITSLTSANLYSFQKSKAKGNAELAFIGEKKLEEVKVQRFSFNESDFAESHDLSFDFFDNLDADHKYWLNVHGLHDVEMIKQIAQKANLDRLSLRQLLDTTQRPKVVEYDTYLFFSVKSILKNGGGAIDIEQLSFVLGKNYVISFQEKEGDHFDDIRNRIRTGIGFIRKRTPDYLLIQLLDAILDNYFETIDQINSDVAELEKIVFTDPEKNTLIAIERTKKMADAIKKALSPIMESINNILNNRTTFFQENNIRYMTDLKMSCANAIEEIDATSKSLEGLTNIYFASLSQKMNETMKVLTTVSTIFIPMTFIAGIYGMNFDNMPELRWKYGYFGGVGADLCVVYCHDHLFQTEKVALMKKFLLTLSISLLLILGYVLYIFYSTGFFSEVGTESRGEVIQEIFLPGVEDLQIVESDSFAIFSSDDRGARIAGKEATAGLYYLDLRVFPFVPRLLRVDIEDFRPHGISLYKIDSAKYKLFVVNHANDRHSIEEFVLSKGELFFQRSYSDPSMVSPNDLVATGSSEFYFTNDHKHLSGVLRFAEDYLGLALSNVVYYNGVRFNEAAKGISYPNGIQFDPERKLLFVGSSRGFSLHVFEEIKAGKLAKVEEIKLPAGADNLEFDTAGNLLIGSHPNLLAFAGYMKGDTPIAPSQILQLAYTDKGKYEIQSIFLDDGGLVSGSSTGAKFSNLLFIGNVKDDHVLVWKHTK